MKRTLACSLTFLGLLLLLFSLSACSTEAVLPGGGSPDTLYAPAEDSVLLATAPGLHTLSTTDCTVTLNNNTNFGTVTGVASGSYSAGTQISFTISTRPGVEVGTVKINGVALAAVDGTYTFTVI